MENKCVFKEALEGPVFSPWGKASLEQLLEKHVSNLSKGTDNSEALHLKLEEETALGAL